MKDFAQWTQLTNTRKNGRAHHEPFLKQATLTMINNKKINELEEEIKMLKVTQKIATETTNIDQTKIKNPTQQN